MSISVDGLNGISSTGNITTDGYVHGNGAFLTGIAGGSNVNLGNISQNVVPASNVTYSLGNATNQWKDLWVSNNTIYMNSVPVNLTQVTLANGAPANTLSVGSNPVVAEYTNANLGNITASGNITATDSINAPSFNWSNGTPVISNTGNVNVARVSATGNIVTDQYFIGNGAFLTGLPATYANANVVALLSSGIVTSNVITTGNVTGAYFVGNGSQLTGLPATYSNANAASFMAAMGSNSISTTGNITTSGAIINGNLYVTGDTTILGNLIYNDTNTITTSNLVLGLGNNQSGIDVTGGGIVVGNTNQAEWLYNFSSQSWVSNIGISAAGNVSGNYFIGDGSQLTNLPVQAGTYSNANVATYLPTNSTIAFINSNVANTNSNVANLTTSLASTNSNVANNRANITTLQGQVYANANVATYLASNSNVAVRTTGNVTAAYFVGNGSLLTNLPAGNYSNANVEAYLPTSAVILGMKANTVNTNSNVSNISSNVTNLTISLTGTNANVADLTTGLANTDSNVVTLATSLSNTDSNVASTNSNVATLATGLSNTDSNVTTLATGLSNTNSNVADLTTGLADTDSNVANNASNIATLQGQVYTDSNVAIYLATGNITSNIVTTANVNANNLDGNGLLINGDAIITGNANIQGNLTYNDITNITTSDLVLGLGNNQTGVNVTGAGIVVGNTNEAQWLYNQPAQSWATNLSISVAGNVRGANITTAGTVVANGNITGANLNTSGNITGNLFIGNGSQLTGVTSTTASISNGTSNVRIATANASVTVGVAGTANVAVFSSTGITTRGLTLTNTRIALGNGTAQTFQGADAVAIGNTAGQLDQQASAIAIGAGAGNDTQGPRAVAIGVSAGLTLQGSDAVAIGSTAAPLSQGANAVAVGSQSGYSGQGSRAIAIGSGAAFFNQGNNSIAIGAFAAYNDQAADSIVLNATGGVLQAVNTGLFIKPVRNVSANAVLNYNTATSEIGYSNSISVTGTISDGLGPVRRMLSGQFVVGFGSYPAAQGTTVDVGPQGIVLPAAGTYLINYTCRVVNTAAGGYGVVILTDSSNNKLDFSEVITGLTTGIAGYQSTVTSSYLVTTTGAATYKMRLNAIQGTVTALSDNNGVSKVAWVQVSA